MTSDQIVHDPGTPEPVFPQARQHPIEEQPDDALLFLLGSRYCETDRLSQAAWSMFGHVEGWARVQVICDFVRQHVSFGYHHARNTRTALETFNERVGVCRDFADLALTLCRCTNVPARYCTGYLGDIGVPADPNPMDFSGWFEVYLDNKWHVFDARHNTPRIGRILIAYGRDAADVAISNTFSPNTLGHSRVWTDQVTSEGNTDTVPSAESLYTSPNAGKQVDAHDREASPIWYQARFCSPVSPTRSAARVPLDLIHSRARRAGKIVPAGRGVPLARVSETRR